MKAQSLSRYVPFAAVILLGLLVYANTFQNSFHYDDRLYITQNAAIRDLGNIKAMWDFFPSHSRFVALISFALNYHFHRLDVFGYHFVNVLIHIANGMMMWWMVRSLMTASKGGRGLPPVRAPVLRRPSKDINSIALAAALIFIAHPVQTQAVNYISQRMASLATLFYLLSVCLYIAGRLKQHKRLTVVFFAGSFLSAVAGMFTKEIVLSLPLAIAAIEFMFLRPPEGYKKIPKIKLCMSAALIASPLFIVPAMFSFQLFEALFAPHVSMSHAHELIAWDKYLLTLNCVFAKYVQLLFVPWNLNLDYDFAASQSLWEARTLISALALLALAAAAVRLFKKERLASFGILWFFIVLLPEIMPRPHLIFEHKIYLPSVGFCLAASVLLFRLTKNVRTFAAVMAVIIAVFSLLTYQRNKVWKDEISLWSDVVAKSPKKASSHHNLGVAYAKQDLYDLALAQFNEALRLDPSLIQALNYRGTLFEDLGQDALAFNDFDTALKIEPLYAEALYNKGLLLHKRKRFDEALEYYNRTLLAAPRHVAALNNRSGIYIDRGQYEPAIQDMTAALAIDAYALTIYANRARLYGRMGRLEEAKKDILKLEELRKINRSSIRLNDRP